MRLPRFPRRRLLILLLLGTVVVPALLLSAVALRLLADLERVERQGWIEYGDYLTRVASQEAEHRLWEEAQRVMVGVRASPPQDPQAALSRLREVLAANHLFRRAFLVAPDGAIVAEPAAQAAAATAAGRAAAAAGMLAMGAEQAGPAPIHQLAGSDGGVPYQITYFTVRGWDRRLIGTVVLLWDLDDLLQRYFPALFAAGPPATPAPFRDSMLESTVGVTVVDAEGHTVFTSASGRAPLRSSSLVAARPFRDVLQFWRLQVHLDDRGFERWMRSVRIAHLALIAGMIAVIGAAMVLLIRWFGKEMEYVELQATFVSNVSHEFKTPLALICLYADTLALDRVQEADRRRHFLRTISKEATRLTGLIDNVLDMARLGGGRRTYRLEAGDIGAIVRETIESYRYQLDQNGFRLDCRLPEQPLVGRVDAEALHRVLINLLDNAVKYSEERREIQVAVRRQGGMAVISVRDRGRGIPPADQQRIFDMFYRAAAAGHPRTARGFGLGLPLVRHIVGGHGGTIVVKSRPGEGSTFTVKLPLAEPDGSPG